MRVGPFGFVNREVEYGIGPFRTGDLGVLRTRLEQLHVEDPARCATIDPRKGTVYQDVVVVLDAVADAGFDQITFIGSYED